MVAGCWLGNTAHWRQSSSFGSVACDGVEDLDHAIRTGALDLLEKGVPRLLSQECYVHCACQYLRFLSVVRLLFSPCHNLLVRRAMPTLPGRLIEADIRKELFHRASQS